MFTKIEKKTHVRMLDMSLELTSYNVLRLVHRDEQGRKTTVLSLSIRTKDVYEHTGSSVHTDDETVNKWVNGEPEKVAFLEEMILTSPAFDNWCSETLRKRLIGQNRIPNIDYGLEREEDSVSTEMSDHSSVEEVMAQLALEEVSEAEMMKFSQMFELQESSESSDSDPTERVVEISMLGVESSMDFSWLDQTSGPVSPSLATDSAVTNHYHNEFISEYSNVMGREFRLFMARRPSSLASLVRYKRLFQKSVSLLRTVRESDFVDIV
jgi:hypothetical protein